MNEREIRDYAQGWYTLGRKFLPEMGSVAFPPFAGRSNAFTYQVNDQLRHSEDLITMRLSSKTDTAFVDLITRTIHISANVFDPQMYMRRFENENLEDIEELAIAAVNGLVIHEALHIKHTDHAGNVKSILALSDRYGEVRRKFGDRACAFAWNVIEDLYIEANVDPKLERWLQSCSDMFLSVKDLDAMNRPLSGLWDALNICVMYKNKELRDHEAFALLPHDTRRILETIVDKGTMKWLDLKDRVDLSFNLLETLSYLLDDTEDGDGSGDGADGDFDGDEGDGSGSGGGNESSDHDNGAGDAAASDEMKRIMGMLDGMGDEFDSIDEGLREASVRTALMERPITEKMVAGEELKWRDPEYFDVYDAPKYYPPDWEGEKYDGIDMVCDTDYSFMRDLVAIRTLNRSPGRPRNRGAVMVKQRLTRITTDGKIFAKRDAQRRRLKRMEIIILVDLSGSTAGAIANREMGAARDISRTLRNADIPHSVYGHSSSGSLTPHITHIFSHDMHVTNVDQEKRFKATRWLKLIENYDGPVIESISNMFTERVAERYIIVLSDGSPSAPRYRGTPSSKHTQSVVQEARRRGINVFAISVVKYVVSQNNSIYGKEFNIDASKNLSEQFRRLIKRLTVN